MLHRDGRRGSILDIFGNVIILIITFERSLIIAYFY